MYYLESDSTDPSWNLAEEEYLADWLPAGESCLFLWQNDNTIVIGKNQDALGEINQDYVREHGIRVRRRLSGGGAVYHDLGNLNYTWIADAPRDSGISFAPFCEPVQRAIASYGVTAELSGRNDLVVNGRKISGNAQYFRNGKVIHHGAILIHANLQVLCQALRVDRSKFQGKGIQSVESRVCNLSDCIRGGLTVADFRQRLTAVIAGNPSDRPLTLTREQQEDILSRKARYDSWQWNYGYSPSTERRDRYRVPGCGTVEISCQTQRGLLEKVTIRGDFFGQKDVSALEAALAGCQARFSAVRQRLESLSTEEYIAGLTPDALAAMIAPKEEQDV